VCRCARLWVEPAWFKLNLTQGFGLWPHRGTPCPKILTDLCAEFNCVQYTGWAPTLGSVIGDFWGKDEHAVLNRKEAADFCLAKVKTSYDYLFDSLEDGFLAPQVSWLLTKLSACPCLVFLLRSTMPILLAAATRYFDSRLRAILKRLAALPTGEPLSRLISLLANLHPKLGGLGLYFAFEMGVIPFLAGAADATLTITQVVPAAALAQSPYTDFLSNFCVRPLRGLVQAEGESMVRAPNGQSTGLNANRLLPPALDDESPACDPAVFWPFYREFHEYVATKSKYKRRTVLSMKIQKCLSYLRHHERRVNVEALLPPVRVSGHRREPDELRPRALFHSNLVRGASTMLSAVPSSRRARDYLIKPLAFKSYLRGRLLLPPTEHPCQPPCAVQMLQAAPWPQGTGVLSDHVMASCTILKPLAKNTHDKIHDKLREVTADHGVRLDKEVVLGRECQMDLCYMPPFASLYSHAFDIRINSGVMGSEVKAKDNHNGPVVLSHNSESHEMLFLPIILNQSGGFEPKALQAVKGLAITMAKRSPLAFSSPAHADSYLRKSHLTALYNGLQEHLVRACLGLHLISAERSLPQHQRRGRPRTRPPQPPPRPPPPPGPPPGHSTPRCHRRCRPV
jgi:hypothetical protein